MSQFIPGSEAGERRRCERIGIQRKMLLEFANGEKLHCNSRDISLSGVLLQLDQVPEGMTVGQQVNLFLFLGNDELSEAYPCEVSRISDSGIGLALDKKHAISFGKALTRRAFIRQS